MAKRFIDTGLFEDEWFTELSTNGKLLWIYYLTRCDHAGLLKYNKRLIEFQTGIKSIDTVFEELGNRLVRVSEVLFFCPKFISFQYPDFPKSKVKQQDSAVKLLQSVGLMDSEMKFTININSLETLSKELTNSYGNDNDNGNGNETDNENKEFEHFWNLYGKKVDRAKVEKAWNRIPKKLHETIYAHVAGYVRSTPDIQFRKNPLTYIHSRSWENPIFTPSQQSKPKPTPYTQEDDF